VIFSQCLSVGSFVQLPYVRFPSVSVIAPFSSIWKSLQRPGGLYLLSRKLGDFAFFKINILSKEI